MAEFSLVALKDEIVGDPQGLGYENPWTGNQDQGVADLINAKNFTVTRAQVDSEELSMAVEKAAFLGLSPSETDWLVWITSAQTVIITDDLVDALYGGGSVFGGGTGAATRAALQAVIEVVGSRAEVLWGVGRNITVGELGRAFNLV